MKYHLKSSSKMYKKYRINHSHDLFCYSDFALKSLFFMRTFLMLCCNFRNLHSKFMISNFKKNPKSKTKCSKVLNLEMLLIS